MYCPYLTKYRTALPLIDLYAPNGPMHSLVPIYASKMKHELIRQRSQHNTEVKALNGEKKIMSPCDV